MTTGQKILLAGALILGLLFRLYKLNSPVADWHSHRQADTASVTRLYAQNGLDLLHPQYHDLSNVQSGLENPQGYRMVEFPVYNVLSLYFHKITSLNIEVSSRLVSIIFSLGSAILIFLTGFRFTRTFVPSYLAAAFFLFLPFNIYYSRTILPEPAAVFFMLLSLYWFPDKLILSGISLALSILLKPYTALILFPTFAYLTLNNLKKFFIHKSYFINLFIFLLISFLPFVLWRLWIGRYPEGIPKSDWLLNNGTTTTFPNWWHGIDLTFLNKLVAFRPHWWHWLFFERIGNLILGGFGLVPLFLGFVYKKNQTQRFSATLAAGVLLYFIIIAQGNIQHDYYQILIVPSLSFLAGFGSYYFGKFTFDSKVASTLVLVFILALGIYFSWDQVKTYYLIDHPDIIAAGQKAREILPQNSLIIAPYQGDTAFLYQTGFRGWPTEIYDFKNILTLHPNNPVYLVSVNYDNYTNSMIAKFPTVYRSPQFVILKVSP